MLAARVTAFGRTRCGLNAKVQVEVVAYFSPMPPLAAASKKRGGSRVRRAAGRVVGELYIHLVSFVFTSGSSHQHPRPPGRRTSSATCCGVICPGENVGGLGRAAGAAGGRQPSLFEHRGPACARVAVGLRAEALPGGSKSGVTGNTTDCPRSRSPISPSSASGRRDL